MKPKNGLILTSLILALASRALADTPATPAPISTDPSVAAATNQPAAKKPRKTAKKKATTAAAKKPVVATPNFGTNVLAVAKQNNINIRGQANINSEVVGHLKQGETVTVLKEVTLKHPKTDEPAKWAQIALPAGTHVWVNGTFLDTNQVVTATKLNLRSGAGENYSVVGMLHKGDTVKALNVKGDWAEIDAPANSYAFVAAHLLSLKEGGAAPIEPTNPPVASVVENPPPIATPTTNNPTTTDNQAAQNPLVITPPIPAVQPPPAVDEPPAKRIVQREGIVGGTVSIQAPTHFELESLDDGKPMDYLYSSSTNLVIQHYKGLTVLVSGEESLDERWPNTPVITVQRIQLVK